MTLGDRGNDVTELQEFLIDYGYLKEKESYYGVKTKRAVLRVQEELGLTPTGEWNESYYTLFKLKKGNARRVKVRNAGGSSNKSKTTSSSKKASTSTKTVTKTTDYPKGNGALTYDYISCYVYNMNTGTMINFGIATPEEVNDSNTANFEDQAVKGRSSPFKAYDSSGPRNISFTIELSADYCKEGIVQTVNKLEALVYPHKQTVIVEPRCRFVLGKFLKVTAVPVSVDVIWKKPYKDGIYTLADVSITLNEVESVGTFAKEVESR